MTTVDDYIKNVIGLGDQGSRLLAARSAPTLKNCCYVDVVQDGMNGIAVVRVPPDYDLVVHTASGDPSKRDLREHALSLVDRLVEQARRIGAQPVAFANIIDSATGDLQMLETIVGALVEKSHQYKIAIMNGENAILGNRITRDANVSGTMVSMLPKNTLGPGRFGPEPEFIVDDPQGKPVYMNSDGVGTKTEFYERARTFGLALDDTVAMKVDDAIKLGATPLVITDVVETRGTIPTQAIRDRAQQLMDKLKIPYLVHFEPVGERIQGFAPDADAFNVSGSVVSVIDEEQLRHPPKPSAGEYLIAVRGRPNPRSNGITDKRRIMTQVFGQQWHETDAGKIFLQYLAQPSTILFPLFQELLAQRAGTSFYHMSGGAYNGKLARPLAKQNLFVHLDGLFPPDWREAFFAGISSTDSEKAYAKWPMGNDGFVTSPCAEKVIQIAQKTHGLEAKVVGRLEKAGSHGTGVCIRTSDGKLVYFSGKD